MARFVTSDKVFPRVRDNLVIIDYPSLGVVTPVQVDYIETSEYEYQTSATVTSSASSVYASNALNALIPTAGHFNIVIPTINPECVLFTETVPTSTGAAGALVLADGDCNTRVIASASSSATVSQTVAYESTRMRLKMPGTVPWWGIDSQTDPGSIDWLNSSPEFPNSTYMFAVTDALQQGTIQTQFEMPTNNVAATTGMKGSARFFIGFLAFSVLDEIPRVYTPIQTKPPGQGTSYQVAIGAQRVRRPANTVF